MELRKEVDMIPFDTLAYAKKLESHGVKPSMLRPMRKC